MRELSSKEVEQVSGGALSAGEAAGAILALGAFGGPATFGFAFPIAMALMYVSV